jgi:hypothetical protein
MDLRDVSLFQNCQDRLQLWKAFLDATRPAKVAEVGVWLGDFAAAMLQHCPYIETYYMIDPWAHLSDWNKPFNVSAEQFEVVYREAMRKTEFAKDRRVILRGRTKEVVGQLADAALDFVYIDGDHTLRGITLDLLLMFNKVRPGGFIGGDDFNPTTQWEHGPGFEPTLVCPFAVYFAEAMDAPIRALAFNQFVLARRQSGFEFIDPTGRYGKLTVKAPPGAGASGPIA